MARIGHHHPRRERATYAIPRDPLRRDAQTPDGTENTVASANASPLPINTHGNAAAQGGRVAWSLRKNDNDPAQSWQVFAFSINPQSITRQSGARAQLYATKSQFYVNSFGPGATTITVRQLVSSSSSSSGSVGELFMPRTDVISFYQNVYQVATSNDPARRRKVYWHDNHLDTDFGEVPEPVYFPPGGVNLTRSVDLHNVWLLEVTMVSLKRDPYLDIDPDPPVLLTKGHRVQRYRVKNDESVKALAYRLLAQSPARHVKQADELEQAIYLLNPTLRKKRTITVQTVGGSSQQVTVKAFRVHAGESILLPRS